MSLSLYKKKRKFDDTPEPGAAIPKSGKQLIFVVQRHKASRLHYDFRLELDGVLKSWAVPKGPSMNPADKRLAMEVEDHPYAYKDFAGIIPEGNYGAGIVEIWDKGNYTAYSEEEEITDPVKALKAGLKKGDLKFVLNGKKLKGSFVLVRIKNRFGSKDNTWLLIKHHDEYAIDKAYDSEEKTLKSSPINKALLKEAKVPKKTKKKSL
jgi:bifunctional non-homologous end joining protein LigD